MNDDIKRAIESLAPVQRDYVVRLYDFVITNCPRWMPSKKWGNIVFSDATSNVIAISPHKTYCNLYIFNGVALVKRFLYLIGGAKGMRRLRYTYNEPIKKDLLLPVSHALYNIS